MVPRAAKETLLILAKQFRAIALVGPRQSGKSTLVKEAFPGKPYVSLEGLETKQLAEQDPKAFLGQFPQGAIIDEAHRVPELFNYLQQILDESNERGKFILTGSNNFLMLENITQSLAGRIGYIDLLPFSLQELSYIKDHNIDLNNVIFKGGYPAVTYEKVDTKFWFPAYMRTYIERDVRQIKNITDLSTFQRFMYLCASRTGQQLNLSNMAIECGIDHKTANSWISVMQASYIIHLLQPYHQNYSKRIIKSPKLYFCDTGLACYLLGMESVNNLIHHPMKGALFENLVINEFIKNRFNHGQRSNLFYWRDVSGHELDVIVDHSPAPIAIEIKSGMTLNQDFYKGLKFWNKLTGHAKTAVIYGGDQTFTTNEGMEIVGWKNLGSYINSL